MRGGILPIGTKCFFEGEPCIIYQFFKMGHYKKEPMYIIKSLSGDRRLIFHSELTMVVEGMDNASLYKQVLRD